MMTARCRRHQTPAQARQYTPGLACHRLVNDNNIELVSLVYLLEVRLEVPP